MKWYARISVYITVISIYQRRQSDIRPIGFRNSLGKDFAEKKKQTAYIIYFIVDCSSKRFVYLITRKQCLKCTLGYNVFKNVLETTRICILEWKTIMGNALII